MAIDNFIIYIRYMYFCKNVSNITIFIISQKEPLVNEKFLRFLRTFFHVERKIKRPRFFQGGRIFI
ncbi:MAG TPA: hypothetical protein DEV87_04890 [Clostridiales bacterium]|nr:hypothetical protein [Clostridiales bacterium]